MAEGVTERLLGGVLSERAHAVRRLEEAWRYYAGEHAILERQRRSKGTANNRLVINHAKYIADMASAYLIGNAITYSAGDDPGLEPLLAAYDASNIDSVDAELARHAAIFGRGAEIVYADQAARPRAAALDPRSAFVVYDDTVAHNPLIGVHIIPRVDEGGEITGTDIDVYDATARTRYAVSGGSPGQTWAVKFTGARAPHRFGAVPITEYWNNSEEAGDFAQVLTLIDAYNALTSDRVNDKEQLVDALLVLTSGSFGDTGAEVSAALVKLRAEKVLELPEGARAEYLTKQLNETEVQVLADALARDIHKIAMVPALTDEHFAEAASGIAMRFKLLGFDQLIKGKERWFREGLRSRLRLFAAFLARKGAPRLDPEAVQITFARGLPVNDLEQAQMVQTLRDIVPEDILLAQLPFVGDVDEAMRALGEQRAKQWDRERRMLEPIPYPEANAEGAGPGGEA
jgi:SPP1 family phage portal protein